MKMISDKNITGFTDQGFPIYMGVFKLTGTERQQQIVVDALNELKFPFNELQLPYPPTEIGWQNLNAGQWLSADEVDSMGRKFDRLTGPKQPITGMTRDQEGQAVRLHGGVDHERNYIYGVMYPGFGMIYIDNSLVDRPDAAISTVMAEIAHDVDYFHPKFQDWQRDEAGVEFSPKRRAILALQEQDQEVGTHKPHAATWWEVADYSAEYFKLPAEAFMQNFAISYSDRDLSTFFNGFGDHVIRKELAQQLIDILDIPRTDQIIDPMPTFYIIGRSITYHSELHYANKKNRKQVTSTKGLKPCKTCIK